MSTKPIFDGDPAFPRATTFNPVTLQPWNDEQSGMSLRDWFAGHVLQGEIAAYGLECYNGKLPDLAAFTYELADAMIAARSKTD